MRPLRIVPSLLLVGCAGGLPAATPAAPAPLTAAPEPQPITSASAQAAAPPPPAPAASPAATATDAPVPLIHIIIEQQDGYEGASRTEKLKDAVAIAEKVLNDPDYRQVMRAYPSIHSLPGFTQATLFGGGTVTSSHQPMDDLLRGNGRDGQIHVWLSIEDHGNEDGHTNPNAEHNAVTFSKGSIIDHMTVAQLADHLVHEHMHRIGFEHAKHRSAERCDSVPYAFGRTVCQFATKKYGLAGRCDVPTDWPPEEPRRHDSAHGPHC
jgi:hypothetical protein